MSVPHQPHIAAKGHAVRMRHRSDQEVKRGARVLATTSIMTVAIVARPVRIEGFAVNSKTARAARAYLTSEIETSLMQFAAR